MSSLVSMTMAFPTAGNVYSSGVLHVVRFGASTVPGRKN